MKNLFLISALALFLASCGSTSTEGTETVKNDSTACCAKDTTVVVDTVKVDTASVK